MGTCALLEFQRTERDVLRKIRINHTTFSGLCVFLPRQKGCETVLLHRPDTSEQGKSEIVQEFKGCWHLKYFVLLRIIIQPKISDHYHLYILTYIRNH